ncbi:Importin subunit beta-1 [Thelohanellus kitauei]|uniref:Importin subunit beta-1 n=1 Tax=Thelohanellus kitauei TaxID=669202 RepID=A0A0C2MVE1_THEKT|nr:Importin subunit beta-1 [Thelohanellus kitauei]
MDVPKSAYNVLFALSNIVKASYNCQYEVNHKRPDTYWMSSCYQNLFDLAFTTLDRPDAHHDKLRIAVNLLLNALIECYPNDTKGILVKNLEIMLQKLGTVCTQTVNPKSKSQYFEFSEMHSVCCDVLQNFFIALKNDGLSELYQTLLMMLTSFSMITEDPMLQENLLLALGTLISNIGEDALMLELQYLINALLQFAQNSDDAVGTASLSCIFNVVQIISFNIKPYVEHIIDVIAFIFYRRDSRIETLTAASKLLNGFVCELDLEFKPYVTQTLDALYNILLVDIIEVVNEDHLERVDVFLIESWTVYINLIKNIFYRNKERPSGGDYLIWKKHIPAIADRIQMLCDETHNQEFIRTYCIVLGNIVEAFKGFYPKDVTEFAVLRASGNAINSNDWETKKIGRWLDS